MAQDTIRVVARFGVKAEHVDAFLEAAEKTLVTPTQGEPGCLEYALWQDAADPTKFFMVEEWASAKHLEVHLAQPGLRDAIGKLMPMASEAPAIWRLRRPAQGGH